MLISKQEFNQNYPQNLEQTEPVFITDHGQITNVVLRYDEYRQLTNHKKTEDNHISALEWFRSFEHPDVTDIELNLPPRSKAQRPPVEFD